jgi:hypothetical protein
LEQLSTNETRWQRIIFDEPAVLTYQTMDGELVGVPVSLARDLNSFPRSQPGLNRVKDYPYFKMSRRLLSHRV